MTTTTSNNSGIVQIENPPNERTKTDEICVAYALKFIVKKLYKEKFTALAEVTSIGFCDIFKLNFLYFLEIYCSKIT